MVFIVSVNVGYTLFLFPLLGMLYPSRVPLTLGNLASFIVVDSVWGVILALITYAVMRVTKTSLSKASLLSVILVWIVYWVPLVLVDGSGLVVDDLVILLLDFLAALVTWFTVLMLSRLSNLA